MSIIHGSMLTFTVKSASVCGCSFVALVVLPVRRRREHRGRGGGGCRRPRIQLAFAMTGTVNRTITARAAGALVSQRIKGRFEESAGLLGPQSPGSSLWPRVRGNASSIKHLLKM